MFSKVLKIPNKIFGRCENDGSSNTVACDVDGWEKWFSHNLPATLDKIFTRKHLGSKLWLLLVADYGSETARFLLHCGFNLFWVEAKESWEKLCPSAHKTGFAK